MYFVLLTIGIMLQTLCDTLHVAPQPNIFIIIYIYKRQYALHVQLKPNFYWFMQEYILYTELIVSFSKSNHMTFKTWNIK